MTVQVAFELRKVPPLGPASALFLPTRDAAELLAVCTRLGLDPSGRVFDVSGGFLLELDRPTNEPIPGATRLRALAPDFYLPVDAELVPALLDDEASGLVRDAGLVFLPGGRILGFDRRVAIDPGKLLVARPRPPRAWAPLPEPRRLADRVVAINWEPPEVPAEALYQDFEQDLRRPGARKPAADDIDRTDRPDESDAELPSTESGEGQGGEAGVGSEGGFPPGGAGIAASFRELMGQAGARLSALREKFQWEWVDHSSLIQKLIHEFREGDPTRALRHAFSMAPADDRHHWVGWGNRLPWSRAIYNLMDLLGRAGRGQVLGIWRARPDLLDELTREYRKAAEEAIRQGDFRRAAYIYGKLLGEDRMAAQVLQRGGLHRDAAILYLKKINDLGAAARAFEAAGAADRAIELYRQLGEHIAAGDLLRRIGEEDAAIAEYLLAADRAASSAPPEYHASGTILKVQARRPDLAIEHFRKGWDRRPAGNATICAMELAILHGGRGQIESIRRLLDEADAFFRSDGTTRDAETFYNTTTLMAQSTPAMAPFAEEVRDRALRALAGRLQADVEAGLAVPPTISALFGAASVWPAALIRDAEFAASAAREQSRSRDRDRGPSAGGQPSFHLVQLGHGTVTAISQASVTRDLFVGFGDGKVIRFRPGRNEVVRVARNPGVVSALAVDPEGQAVAALRHTEHSSILSCCLRLPDGTFRSGPDGHFPGLQGSWLTPIVSCGPDWLIGLGHAGEIDIVDAASWMPQSRPRIAPAVGEPPRTALLVPVGPAQDRFLVLSHDGRFWVMLDPSGQELDRAESVWSPAAPAPRPLRAVPAIWNFNAYDIAHGTSFIELIGLDELGAVFVSDFRIENGAFKSIVTHTSKSDQTYLAATRSRPGSNTVIAVSRSRIDWLNLRNDRYRPFQSLPLPSLSPPVGCFASNSIGGAHVIFSDGTAARIETPRGRGPSSGARVTHAG